MPLYDVRNKNTGEIEEIFVSISNYDTFMAENPHYEQVHLSAPALVSGTKSALRVAGSEWQNHLKAIKKGSGKNNTINT